MAHGFWPRALALASLISAVAWLMAGAQDGRADGGPPPDFLLPWRDGQPWLTGVAGFHGSYDALDFFPPDTPLSLDVACEGEEGWKEAVSSYWALASAAGLVTYAQRPLVIIDHGSGWSSAYFHLDAISVTMGQTVAAGDPLGHPSTYGGCTTGPHLHFWVQGPEDATTAAVQLSGRSAASFGPNVYVEDTGNPPTPPPGAALAGDADCDGDADAVDALAVLRLAAGLPETAACAPAADADCSGTLDAVDALLVLRLAAGLGPAPRPCAAPAALPLW